MHLSELKVMKRKNLGNYEHLEVTVAVSVGEGDTAQEVISTIEEVLGLYGLSGGVKPVANVKTKTIKNNEVVEEKNEVVTPEEVIIEEVVEEKKTTTKKASAKKAAVVKEDALSPVQVTEALVSLTKRLREREAVNALIVQVCGTLKQVKDMSDVERTKLLKAVQEA